MRVRMWTLCLIASAGCSPCSNEPLVPPPARGGPRAASKQGAPPPSAERFAAVPSTPFRGALQDGARAIAAVPAGAGHFVLAKRGNDFEVILVRGRIEETLVAHSPGDGCRAEGLLRGYSDRFAVGEINESCSEGLHSFAWAVTTEPEPRVLYDARSHPAPRAAVRLGLELTPMDGDEGPGVDVTVQPLESQSEAPAFLRTRWTRQPGGDWALLPSEPEGTLAGLSDAAEDFLERDPTAALGAASDTLLLHRAVCATSEPALVTFARSKGLACVPSRGAGRAAAIVATAAARLRNVTAAIDAYRTLKDPWFEVPTRDGRLAMQALAAMTAPTHVLVQGPAAPPTGDALVRAPLLRFVDDHRLWVGGPIPTEFDVTTAEARPAAEGGAATWFTNSDASLYVRKVFRDCDGYHLEVATGPSGQVDPWAAPTLATPLAIVAAPPPFARCPLEGALRRDMGDFQLLGWAPQGIVVARGPSATIVALDAKGQPLGAPQPVSPNAPLPAPLPAGPATPDGRAFVFALDMGLVVRTPGALSLVRSADWPADAGPITELVLTGDARTFAFVRSGAVWILRPATVESPAAAN